jgi:hypothetical protein
MGEMLFCELRCTLFRFGPDTSIVRVDVVFTQSTDVYMNCWLQAALRVGQADLQVGQVDGLPNLQILITIFRRISNKDRCSVIGRNRNSEPGEATRPYVYNINTLNYHTFYWLLILQFIVNYLDMDIFNTSTDSGPSTPSNPSLFDY